MKITQNKTVLYLVFLLSIVNISYFMFTNRNMNVLIFGAFVAIFYSITKNMTIVLGSAILLTDILWGIERVTSFSLPKLEGLTNKTELTYDEFKQAVTKALTKSDPKEAERENVQFVKTMKSLQEVQSKKYYDTYKINYNKLKDRTWVDENIIEFNTIVVIDNPEPDVEDKVKKLKKSTTEPKGYDENEHSNDMSSSYPGESSDMLEKVKKNTPELAESLKALKGIDMDQINKLINNLNTVMETF